MIQAIALLITAALVVGGLVGSGVIGGPSPEDEMASIEEVAVAYGASEGAEACEYLSASALDQLGGESGCTRSFENVPAAEFEVLEVTTEGETGTARVNNTEPRGTEIDLELVKEGDEWKISSFPGLQQIAPPSGAPTDELLQPPGELLPPGEGGVAPPGPPPASEPAP